MAIVLALSVLKSQTCSNGVSELLDGIRRECCRIRDGGEVVRLGSKNLLRILEWKMIYQRSIVDVEQGRFQVRTKLETCTHHNKYSATGHADQEKKKQNPKPHRQTKLSMMACSFCLLI